MKQKPEVCIGREAHVGTRHQFRHIKPLPWVHTLSNHPEERSTTSANSTVTNFIGVLGYSFNEIKSHEQNTERTYIDTSIVLVLTMPL